MNTNINPFSGTALSVKGIVPEVINNTKGLYEGNLRYYFKALFNSRGANNPFHNIRHLLNCLVRCYQAVEWYKEQNQPISLYDARSLFCGAVYHDMEHSGRCGKNDDLNIEAALRAWNRDCSSEDAGRVIQVENLIASTEYDNGKHTKEGNSELKRILRDADLSEALSPAWIRLLIYGLATELGVTPIQMLRAQKPFLENLKFESLWGKTILQPLVAEKISEASEILSIIEE